MRCAMQLNGILSRLLVDGKTLVAKNAWPDKCEGAAYLKIVRNGELVSEDEILVAIIELLNFEIVQGESL